MATVSLNVYDLSNGMARQLSPALLGKTIDGVWHTGVQVFGKEFFFSSGGIVAMAPELISQRYGMQPVRTIRLGETCRTLHQLEQFLRGSSARFTDATYDLLHHNCNHFSDEVAKYLVGSGIPRYIVDLPHEVLNSPFGAMVRPMLENVSNQMRGAPGDQLFSIPFNDPSRANLADLSTGSETFATVSVNLASRRFKISGSPALHLDKMIQRIKSIDTEKLLSEDDIEALDALLVHVANGNKEPDSTKSFEWWKTVSKLLAMGHKSSFFFPAMGLYRVLLLQPLNSAEAASTEKACFEAIMHVTELEPSPLTFAQRTLVLSVILNAVASSGFSAMALAASTRFLPFVFATIANSSTSQEARGLSAYIISNCCLAMKIGEEAVVTTIVCGAIETLDRISRLQSSSAAQQQTIEGLMVGLGRLLHNFEAARSLSTDLGLAEIIRRLNATPGLNAIQPLLSEVVLLI